MGEFSWFKITTRREREKQEKKYQKRMFPLGDGQREKELALLAALFPGKKDPGELLYQLICVKECMLEEDEEDRQAALARWRAGTLVQEYTSREKAVFLALERLEHACASLEEFPNQEQLLAEAERIYRELPLM